MFLTAISHGKKKHRRAKFGHKEVEIASTGSPSKPNRESIIMDHHIFDDYVG